MSVVRIVLAATKNRAEGACCHPPKPRFLKLTDSVVDWTQIAFLPPPHGGNINLLIIGVFGVFDVVVISVQQSSNKDRRMTAKLAANGRTDHGRFARGNDIARRAREAKAVRIAARADELASRFGGFEALEPIDAGRVRLAARHFVTAEVTHNLNQSIRATRVAEMLLARIRPKEAPLPSLRELLAG